MPYRVRNLVTQSQSFKKGAVILVFFSLFSKVVGFFRSVLVARYFGATSETDAFLMALGITSVFIGVFSSGLYNAITPFFYEFKKNPAQYQIYRVSVQQIVLIFAISLALIALLIGVESLTIVKVVAFGFDYDRVVLSSRYLRYLLIYGYFNFLLTFFFGLIQARSNFLLPALLGALGNVVLIVALIYFHNSLGIGSLLLGQIGSILVPLALLSVIYSREMGAFFSRICDIALSVRQTFKSCVLRFFFLYFPVVASSSVRSLYQVIDRFVSSMLPVGAVSMLYYAQVIYIIPYNLISIPVSIAMFPDLTRFSALEKTEHMRVFFSRVLGVLTYIMLPVVIIILTTGEYIVNLVFRHGNFGIKHALVTSCVLKIYSVGLIPISVNAIFQKYYFSRKNTKVPTLVGAVSFLLNAIADYVLALSWGVYGIAVATAVSSIVATVMYVLIFSRQFPETMARLFVDLSSEIRKLLLPAVALIVLNLAFSWWVGCTCSWKLLVLGLWMIDFVVYMAISYHNGNYAASLVAARLLRYRTVFSR